MDLAKLTSGQRANFENTITQLKKFGITPDITKPPLLNTAKEAFFKTTAGKETRGMNLAAIAGVKTAEMPRPKALDPEDIKLLSSDAADMVKRWTSWVDPKSGKTYTIINKANNPDGTKVVRILNEAGEIVKERTIQPKKIVMLDVFEDNGGDIAEIFRDHGGRVKKFIQRNNPIADVECMNLYSEDSLYRQFKFEKLNEALEAILRRIKDGEQIDVVNCSLSLGVDLSKIRIDGDNVKKSYPACKDLINYYTGNNETINKTKELIQDILARGKRVVFGAGNEGEFGYNIYTGIDGVDTVGALDKTAKIAEYSSSRAMTQHFEYVPKNAKVKKHGINITGKPGVDIPYKGTSFEQYEGKKLKDYIVDGEKCRGLSEKYEASLTGKSNPKEFAELIESLRGKFVKSKVEGCYVPALRKPHTCDSYVAVTSDKDGYMIPYIGNKDIQGTSFAAPIRSAKIALNEAMKEILG